MQAADALDDYMFRDWFDITVGIFRRQSMSHHRWRGRSLPSQISSALSKLPYHLHQRVIEAATPCHKADQHLLAAWLELLPIQHHADMVSRMIPDHPGRSLSASADVQTLPFLRALMLLPHSPPLLLSLTLGSQTASRSPFQRVRLRGEPMHDKAAALAAALLP